MKTLLQGRLIPIVRGTAIFLTVFIGCEAIIYAVAFPVAYSESSATWGKRNRAHVAASEYGQIAEPELDAALITVLSMLILALPSGFLGIGVSRAVERRISGDQWIAEYERNFAGKSRFTGDKRSELADG
ncbi:MAG: hypothetical protein H8F28_24275 [Fibrella sp.]|nr:hypothetical protein [Armatimonadota bacterium]